MPGSDVAGIFRIVWHVHPMVYNSAGCDGTTSQSFRGVHVIKSLAKFGRFSKYLAKFQKLRFCSTSARMSPVTL